MDAYPIDDIRLEPQTQALRERYAERKEYLDHTFRKLNTIYGSDQLEKVESRTFTEYAYRKYQFGRIASVTPANEDPDWTLANSGRAAYIVSATRALQHAVELLNDEYGVDIIGNRKQLADDPALFKYVRDSLNETAAYEGRERVVEEDDVARMYASDIVNLFGGSKGLYINGIHNTEQTLAPGRLAHQPLLMNALSQISFYRTVLQDISSARYDAHQKLKYLVSEEVEDFLELSEDWFTKTAAKREQDSATIETILESQKQELDYTILPPGTELETVARQIVEESAEGAKATVDLRRLAVLEDVRQLFGPERCFLMRGKRTGKEMANEQGTLISEDYIGLVMQHHNSDGVVIQEDCLAISPIAQKHAGYIVRQDASEGISWREILSLPKHEAIQFFNARRLRFDPVSGEDRYEAYVKKVITLLTCPTEQFDANYRLRRTKGGEYEMIYRPQNIGAQALLSAALFDIERSE